MRGLLIIVFCLAAFLGNSQSIVKVLNGKDTLPMVELTVTFKYYGENGLEEHKIPTNDSGEAVNPFTYSDSTEVHIVKYGYEAEVFKLGPNEYKEVILPITHSTIAVSQRGGDELKTKRDMHFGVEAGLHVPTQDLGSGTQSLTFGALFEILAKNRKGRFGTGLKYSKHQYNIAANTVGALRQSYPEVVLDSTQELEQINFSSGMLFIPLEYRHHFKITDQASIFIGAGVTAYMYLGPKYEYVHLSPDANGNEVRGSKIESSSSVFNPGTINGGGGFEWAQNDMWQFQVSCFYKYGWSDFGFEKRQINFVMPRASVLYRFSRSAFY